MSAIQENLMKIKQAVEKKDCLVVAVSKTKPVENIKEAYDAGHRDFGENKARELESKFGALPKDIRWHMIGHLQRNKVKYIAPFVSLIHGVDTLKLLKKINDEGEKNKRVIACLLQVHIANEDSKFGFLPTELYELLDSGVLSTLKNIKVKGLMGMASNIRDHRTIREEFSGLKHLFDLIKRQYPETLVEMKVLSMGMSGDYQIAIEEGSSMVRIGSAIFGLR